MSRGPLPPKLVRFALARWSEDVLSEMRRRGRGAVTRMSRATGLRQQTIDNIRSKAVASLETVVCINAYLGLRLDDYLVTRDAVEPTPAKIAATLKGVTMDWKLFGACASLQCGGRPEVLARDAGISLQAASMAVRGEGCGRNSAIAVLNLMGLTAKQFDIQWREQRARNRASLC